MAKCLLYKNEDLSLYFQHECKKPSVVALDYNPNVWEVGQADSWSMLAS